MGFKIERTYRVFEMPYHRFFLLKKQEIMIMTKIKNNPIIKYFIYRTPFRLVHISHYLRQKYFFKHLQAVPVTQFHKVLDAGCGSGIYTEKLAAAYPPMEVTGLDAKEFAS